MKEREQMSKVNRGNASIREDCNGTTIYIGGQPAVRTIKGVGQEMMIRCHSCEHCHLMELENKPAEDKDKDFYYCQANVTDEGYLYEIPDFRTTRCKNWRPKKAWVEAMSKDHGNEDIPTITREEIEARIAQQTEGIDRHKLFLRLRKEYRKAKAEGDDEKCAQLMEEFKNLYPHMQSATDI